MVLLFAALLQAAAPVPQASPAPMICKTFDEIGSRVRKKKVCRTRAEWDLNARGQRAQSEQMRDLVGGNIPPR